MSNLARNARVFADELAAGRAPSVRASVRCFMSGSHVRSGYGSISCVPQIPTGFVTRSGMSLQVRVAEAGDGEPDAIVTRFACQSLSGCDAAVYPGDMFVRTATRRNKDGSAVRYVQLVQNEWDPATKSSRMRVVHSFGREDQLDRAAVERLAGSLGRLLGQGRRAAGAAPELAYAGSVAFGGTYLLDQLWQRLGIGQAMTAMLGGTRRDAAHRAGAVRAGRQPGAGPVLQARRRALGRPQGAHRRAAGHDRRRVLPGDGLAARGPARPGAAGVQPGRGRPGP